MNFDFLITDISSDLAMTSVNALCTYYIGGSRGAGILKKLTY